MGATHTPLAHAFEQGPATPAVHRCHPMQLQRTRLAATCCTSLAFPSPAAANQQVSPRGRPTLLLCTLQIPVGIFHSILRIHCRQFPSFAGQQFPAHFAPAPAPAQETGEFVRRKLWDNFGKVNFGNFGISTILAGTSSKHLFGTLRATIPDALNLICSHC